MAKKGDRDKIAFLENSKNPYQMSVRQVLQTVTRDLRIYRANRLLEQRRKDYRKVGANPKVLGTARGTVVAKKHLALAGDERHILRGMLRDHLDYGSLDTPFSTYLIYRNTDVLKEAYKVACNEFGKLS